MSGHERVEAVVAFVVMALTGGGLVGLTAAQTDVPVVVYALPLFGMFAVLYGQLIGRLLDVGEMPGLGTEIDAPDNATTGFYAVALALFAVGLIVEVATGQFRLPFLTVYVFGGVAVFDRGFRRGQERSAAEV